MGAEAIPGAKAQPLLQGAPGAGADDPPAERLVGVIAGGARSEGSMDASDYPVPFGDPPIMRGRIDRAGGVVTVALTGEFDLAARRAFTAAITQIEATKPRGIVVNVQELSFMDSSGIHGLLGAHRRAEGSHSFAVVNGSGPAHRTLQLAGLDEVLVMVDDPEELPQQA